MVVDDEHLVQLVVVVTVSRIERELCCFLIGRIRRVAREFEDRLDAPIVEVADGLLAAGSHLYLNAFALQPVDQLVSVLEHVGIEATCKPAIGCHNHYQRTLDLIMDLEQRLRGERRILRRGDEHIRDSACPRKGVLHTL